MLVLLELIALHVFVFTRDPRFISKFKAKYCTEVWAEHVATKKKRRLWRRKDDKLTYPYEEK